jgi:hypothetical protein
VFHQFSQAKFTNVGLILSLSKFLLLPLLPQKNKARFKSGQNQHNNNHLNTLIYFHVWFYLSFLNANGLIVRKSKIDLPIKLNSNLVFFVQKGHKGLNG